MFICTLLSQINTIFISSKEITILIKKKTLEKMTNTSRVHVTLEKGYMDLVDELIDVFGATRPQVISNIVQEFFNNPNNDALLNKLRLRKRKIKPPEMEQLEIKIRKYLSVANNIPFEVFVEHLNLNTSFVVENLDKWAEKFDFMFVDNRIVKRG